MRVIGIKINNYRSFGSVNNLIRFDSENIISLIGKNETGKSNTLLAIKDIDFFSNTMKKDMFNNKNRANNDEVSVSVSIKFDKEELREYKVNSCDFVTIFNFYIKDNSLYMDFNGILSEIVASNDELKQRMDILNKAGVNSSSPSNEKTGRLIKNKLENYTKTYINFIDPTNYLYLSSDQIKIYYEVKEILSEYYENFKNLLPKIIYFNNDMVIKNSYTVDEILDKNKSIELDYLLNSISSDRETLVNWLNTVDITIDHKLKTFFEEGLKKLSEKFQEYYKTEKICLCCLKKGNSINFVIDDENGTTNLSERSNGLKWYLSLFLNIRSVANSTTKFLVLCDEPGCNLHVIAQKELLKLFEHFSESGNQLIYTTHSPYMIDVEHLERIRLVSKSLTTNITNGINDNSEKKVSKLETLTPIVQAMGMSLNYDIGPQQNKCNLIVEGISDYYYLNTMINRLNVCDEKRPYILPCTSASNINRVMSILIGWGYDFKILLDNDMGGKTEYKKIKKLLFDDIDNKTFFVTSKNNTTIESLLSLKEFSCLKNIDKVLRAKEFFEKYYCKNQKPDLETEENFKNLFITMGIYN